MTILAGSAGKTPRSSGRLIGSKTWRNLIRRIAIFRLPAPRADSLVYILCSANFPWRDSKFESVSLQRRVSNELFWRWASMVR
jgi:hypothetical protein